MYIIETFRLMYFSSTPFGGIVFVVTQLLLGQLLLQRVFKQMWTTVTQPKAHLEKLLTFSPPWVM